MNHTKRREPITLAELNKKLEVEAKRLVYEKEDDIAKYVSKTANLNGNSAMVFKKKDGTKITKFFRLNDSNDIRIAFEKQYTDKK